MNVTVNLYMYLTGSALCTTSLQTLHILITPGGLSKTQLIADIAAIEESFLKPLSAKRDSFVFSVDCLLQLLVQFHK